MEDVCCFEDIAPSKRPWDIVAGSDGASSSPKGRAGHRMVRYRNRVFMFGGFSEPTSDSNYNWDIDLHDGDDDERGYVKLRHSYAAGPHYNTVHEFNLDTRRWKELQPTSACGNLPRARRGFSMVVSDTGCILIFGGLTAAHGLLNDMWAFNIELCRWRRIEYRNEAPSARYEHTAVAYMSRMYVFGGYDGKRKMNETYEFDLREYTWSLIAINDNVNLPSRRCKHTAVVYSGSMYVLGGFQHLDDGNAARTDLHALDLHTHTWNPVIPIDDEECPEELHLHSAVVSESEDRMYVVGGKVKNEAGEAVLSTVLYSYHFPSQTWAAHIIIKGAGIARQRHAAVLGSVGRNRIKLFVFGGMDMEKRRFYEGMWELRQCIESSE